MVSPDPERPRSSSITLMEAKPAALAASTRAYCRLWLSRLPTTLRQGRLADIDDGRAAEMVRRDLRVHRRPPWLRLWSFGLGSAERGPRGEGRPAPGGASAPRSSWEAVPARARGAT